MASVDFSLASQCMDFCHALASHQKIFTFSLTIGSTFAFSLDTRESLTPAAEAVKRKSPSAIRRNTRRRAEFLQKKAEPLSSCTADFTDVTLASRDGQPDSTHKNVFSSGDPPSMLPPTTAPLAPDLQTLSPPEMTPPPALTTPLPSTIGKPQPARAVKTTPLICSHCGLSKKGHPGPTGDRCIVSRSLTDSPHGIFPTLG